jgi:ribosomal protein S7
MVQGSYDKSFNTKTKIEQALADEIIKAYNADTTSYAWLKRMILKNRLILLDRA